MALHSEHVAANESENSGLSRADSAYAEYSGTTRTPDVLEGGIQPEHIIVHFHLDTHIHTRRLEHAAFERWESMEDLLEAFADDGIIAEELRDVRQETRLSAGNWDACVYAGLEIDIFCVYELPPSSSLKADTNGSSGDEEDQEFWQSGMRETGSSGGRGKRFWFERWRTRVEQEETLGHEHAGREPSRLEMMLGLALMVMLFGMVQWLCG